MPIYAYRCQTCGADAEYIQKFSDPPITVCEACGGALERAVTAAAFHLKGGGWYKDGYASTKAEGGGGGGETKSESKSTETKTESKPAASSDGGGAAASTKAAAE